MGNQLNNINVRCVKHLIVRISQCMQMKRDRAQLSLDLD
ncbi:hypothetical protein VCRA2122O266_120018 [Vibrio crassostreae]|nr:hypothetical protein VCRA2122O266_120018 [Vibrio crassostreae]